MDTVSDIFDADGNLLLADDDSGAGMLSRLLVQIAVDGRTPWACRRSRTWPSPAPAGTSAATC